MSIVQSPSLPTASAWAASPGAETLRRMADLDQYNRWIARKIAPHLGRRILEVGCGIGTMTPFFLEADQVTCVDLSPEAVSVVRSLYSVHPHVSALVADIGSSASLIQVGRERYDTAVCINVLEHIADDAAALRNMREALAPGGKLLLFVPAGAYLYGHLDRALGHYRRYAIDDLTRLVERQGFAIVEASYMNVAGIPGWFLSSRLLERETPPRGLLWLFNLLTPLFARLEETLRPPFGQSIVCVARRPSG